ncbi:uncharacterized protein M6B38_284400 [Iris pallida]|uniref:DUF7755 domain-containing protein n=1 Tax=Iris pallida TaxID=29817 RepID=A0AAX6I1X1_IRIPA|nr:uncharacterized protein M6B38_284400 [Iris pallida]
MEKSGLGYSYRVNCNSTECVLCGCCFSLDLGCRVRKRKEEKDISFQLFIFFSLGAQGKGKGKWFKIKEMEALFARHLVSSICTGFPSRLHLTNSISEELVRFHLLPRRIKKQMGHSCIMPRSKQSAYQDFQDFVKPSRLLPASEANMFTKYTYNEMFTSVELDTSSSFYIVELRTSKDFGSSLSDLNAGILFCLINANGDSILQRISAVALEHPGKGKDVIPSESIHFQRGSVDIVAFKGLKLGRIESLWVGLESGSWRLDGIRLTVIDGPLPLSSSIEGIQDGELDVFQYNFEAENILLGEGGESVAELRPVLVHEFPGEIISSFLKNVDPSASPLSGSELASNAEGMREYSDLKFSLLLYDTILVSMGSAVLLAFSSGERDALSFLVGGIGGLAYLLLLQRSVDGLPIGGEREDLVQGLGTIKGPLLTLAIVTITGAVAAKYGIGNSSMALTPAELFLGVAGFLTCKVAVLLAAFKPIKRSPKEND